MSRVKNSNQKRKQKIKETIIGLSLAISIGVAGSVGSYAYFSDRVNADNGIKITMGTLDVSIGEGFNETDFKLYEEGKPDTLYTKEFTITNTGTLDEILTLKLTNVSFNGNNEDLENVEYSLKIGEKENVISCNLKDLSTQGINIGRLNSGKSILCTATLKNKGIANSSYIDDLKITFDLVVDGVQINYESIQNGGAS